MAYSKSISASDPGRLGEQQMAQLKANGFKWVPSQGTWKRQLNGNRAPREKGRNVLIFCERFNRKKSVPFSQCSLQRKCRAIYAAGQLDFVKPSDGRTVREHQPQIPNKDKGAR